MKALRVAKVVTVAKWSTSSRNDTTIICGGNSEEGRGIAAPRGFTRI
jgi:hypothetical protein